MKLEELKAICDAAANDKSQKIINAPLRQSEVALLFHAVTYMPLLIDAVEHAKSLVACVEKLKSLSDKALILTVDGVEMELDLTAELKDALKAIEEAK